MSNPKLTLTQLLLLAGAGIGALGITACLILVPARLRTIVLSLGGGYLAGVGATAFVMSRRSPDQPEALYAETTITPMPSGESLPVVTPLQVQQRIDAEIATAPQGALLPLLAETNRYYQWREPDWNELSSSLKTSYSLQSDHEPTSIPDTERPAPAQSQGSSASAPPRTDASPDRSPSSTHHGSGQGATDSRIPPSPSSKAEEQLLGTDIYANDCTHDCWEDDIEPTDDLVSEPAYEGDVLSRELATYNNGNGWTGDRRTNRYRRN
jgi:hypothetical protein